MRWSWWRVISINLNSPSLLYVLLLNLCIHFRIWMYSAKFSEVWNHMLLKNPIYFELMLPCVCSFIWLFMFEFTVWEFLQLRNKICCREKKKKKPDLFELMLSCYCCLILQNDIWWKDIWDKIKKQNSDDTGNKHEPHVVFILLYAIYETQALFLNFSAIILKFGERARQIQWKQEVSNPIHLKLGTVLNKVI